MLKQVEMTYVVVNITHYLPEVWRILCKIS